SSSSSTALSVSTMLSPVSPSATGNTLRSLTSSLRDSRCGRAPATAGLNRIRFVSVTKPLLANAAYPLQGTALGCSEGLRDLAGLKTPRAHVYATGCLADEDLDLLQVGVEAPLGRDHRVTAAVAERGALPAAVTYLGHDDRQSSRSATRSAT